MLTLRHPQPLVTRPIPKDYGRVNIKEEESTQGQHRDAIDT